MRNFSRRSFLKGTAAGALGVAAAGFVLPEVVSRAEAATYTATAQGFAGPVTVTATIEDGKITAATAEGPNETPDRGGRACEILPGRVVEAGSVKVDGVAGATMTSNAIFTCFNSILEEAGMAEDAGEAVMKPGVYVGEGKGFDWIEPVRVKITVDETSLLTVDVIELELNREEPVIQKAAIEHMIPRMIENQSVTVDAITGATGVSTGIKLATRDALIKALVAGGSNEKAISHFEKPVEKKEGETVELTYKIVVAGMGGAGTMAALSAAEQMKAAGMEPSILAIETAGKYGGTASNAGEPFAINPKRYCETYNNGQPYTETDTLWDHWMNKFSQGDCKPEMVQLLFDNSGDTIDWLEFDHHVHLHTAQKGFGECIWPVKYQYIYISNQEEGHDYSDTVLGDRSSTVGQYYDRLVKDYTDLGGEYLLETTCYELLYDQENEKVTGLKARGTDGTEYIVHADVVILSGGGFCGNPDMLERYLKDDYFPLKSRDWKLWGMYQNKGQMIQSAIDNGAATYNIGMVPCTHFKMTADILTCYPTYYRDGLEERMQEQNTWSLNDLPYLMGNGGDTMQVGVNGKRNYNEGGTFAFWAGGPVWYTILGMDQLDNLAENGFAGAPGTYARSTKVYGYGGYPNGRPIPQVYEVMEKAIEKGFVFKADTLEELAEKIGVPADVFVNEVARYKGFCESGVDEDFGKNKRQLVDRIKYGPYYAIKFLPTPYSTVAALDVDTNINVLKADGTVMKGLYACGNDSGGVLYTEKDAYAQYGGVALGWAFTSGRLAGINAVNYLKNE